MSAAPSPREPGPVRIAHDAVAAERADTLRFLLAAADEEHDRARKAADRGVAALHRSRATFAEILARRFLRGDYREAGK